MLWPFQTRQILQIPTSEASLIPPCTDQNPSERGGGGGGGVRGENKEILNFKTIFDNFPSVLCWMSAYCRNDLEFLRHGALSLLLCATSAGKLSYLLSQFLNISPSTAVAVSDDLKTAKKDGSTRGLYVTGFPCQIRLRACQ